MPNNIPQQQTVDVGNVLYNPVAGVERSAVQAGVRVKQLDHIVRSEKKEAKKAVLAGKRPTLPQGKSKNPNTLMILAEEFGKCFMAMREGIITQSKDYAGVQQLDQTMATCVQRASDLAVKKEEHEFKISQQIQAYEKHEERKMSILKWILMILGIVLLVVTFVVGFVTGGAADAALPEEMGIEMGEMGGEAAGDTADASIDSAEEAVENTLDSGQESVDVSEEGVEGVGDGLGESSEEIQQEGETNNEIVEELDQSDNENSKSENETSKKWKENLKKFGKGAIKLGVGAFFGSPQLMEYFANKDIAAQMNELAQFQRRVGLSLSVLQENNMYFHFYQQLLTREGGVVEEETNGAAQVIETFGDITNAYRQVAYGLADAV